VTCRIIVEMAGDNVTIKPGCIDGTPIERRAILRKMSMTGKL